MNLDRLTDTVMQRLAENRPKALLIGSAPLVDCNYNYVNQKPYETVVIGRLSPAELLHMPNDAVCDALFAQIPVYLTPQPWREQRNARGLCRELAASEQRLMRMGVFQLARKGSVLTAEGARKLRMAGEHPAPDCRMTPLARDILEGKAL